MHVTQAIHRQTLSEKTFPESARIGWDVSLTRGRNCEDYDSEIQEIILNGMDEHDSTEMAANGHTSST
jgi:hypothetical protein